VQRTYGLRPQKKIKNKKIIMLTALNQYRIMWVFVFFDLPTETPEDRKIYANFRKKILATGFQMFQFSIYIRHCPSKENAEVHLSRIKKHLPPKGKIGLLTITDKQFGDMQIFFGKKTTPVQPPPQQLSFF
jgi:CRISPR-associated protein Cas2